MTKISTERLAALDGLGLDSGGHDSFESGHCAMELVSWLAGEEFSDRPECVDPTLTGLFQSLNDRMNDEDRQILKPFLPRLIGTEGGKENVPKWRNSEMVVWRWIYSDLVPYLMSKLDNKGEFVYTPAEKFDDYEGMYSVNASFADWVERSGLIVDGESYASFGGSFTNSGITVLVDDYTGSTTKLPVNEDGTAYYRDKFTWWYVDDVIRFLCKKVEEEIGQEKLTADLVALIPNALEEIVRLYERDANG